MRPVVAITMGDAAGVGPEIVMKALSCEDVYEICRPLVVGDSQVLAEVQGVAKTSLQIRVVKSVDEALFQKDWVDVFDLELIKMDELVMGRPQAMAGRASYEYVKKAVELALGRKVGAVVTAPLSKEALNLAGYGYPGHTELLAELCGSQEYRMMFVTPSLHVILVTTHLSLYDVLSHIRKDRVLATIILAHESMIKLGVQKPRIAVAGLNPHAGESGIFGREEIEEIGPAVETAKEIGLNVTGPFPADTVFYRANRGEFDIVVAMYHDQGCIPVKLLGFEVGVNVTVGLPIVRTSVDHGTAYRRAGLRLGTGNPTSLLEAIKLAVKLAGAK